MLPYPLANRCVPLLPVLWNRCFFRKNRRPHKIKTFRLGDIRIGYFNGDNGRTICGPRPNLFFALRWTLPARISALMARAPAIPSWRGTRLTWRFRRRWVHGRVIWNVSPLKAGIVASSKPALTSSAHVCNRLIVGTDEPTTAAGNKPSHPHLIPLNMTSSRILERYCSTTLNKRSMTSSVR